MQKKILFVWIVFWPIFLGMFLPYLYLLGHKSFLYLFWEFIFGPWMVEQTVGILMESQSLLPGVGIIIWPIAILWLILLLARKLQQDAYPELRKVVTAIWIISSL